MRLAVFWDTETTGLVDFSKRADDPAQPHLLQLAWMLVDLDGRRVLRAESRLVRGATEISTEAAAVNGLTVDLLRVHGEPLPAVLTSFLWAIGGVDLGVAHNVGFDRRIVESAAHRAGESKLVDVLRRFKDEKRLRCTQAENASIVKSRRENGAAKFASLDETHEFYFGRPFREDGQPHDALQDVQACVRIFLEMERRAAAAVPS